MLGSRELWFRGKLTYPRLAAFGIRSLGVPLLRLYFTTIVVHSVFTYFELDYVFRLKVEVFPS